MTGLPPYFFCFAKQRNKHAVRRAEFSSDDGRHEQRYFARPRCGHCFGSAFRHASFCHGPDQGRLRRQGRLPRQIPTDTALKICEPLFAASGSRVLGVGVAARPKRKMFAAQSNTHETISSTLRELEASNTNTQTNMRECANYYEL